VKFDVAARVERRLPSGFVLDAKFACDASALAIVGPSGSGKSTLLDVIAGVESRGARVVLDGRDVSREPLHRRVVGHVTQDPLLFPHLTVRENLEFSPRARGVGGADVDAIARSLGVEQLLARMPRSLSGGERRRVALARALASRPRVLLLDEPFVGLDETARREAMSLLDHVRRSTSVPIVLVSHRADEVIGLTDFAVRLENGRVAAHGPTASVLRSAETHVDNYFAADVVAPRRVRLTNDVELVAALPESARGRVRLACYAFDVLLATTRPTGLSARNVVDVTVGEIADAGDSLLVSVPPLPLRALVTGDAVRALDLRPGAKVFAIVKATSIAFLGPA
jgi:molybdate transport system ATP-binding protein